MNGKEAIAISPEDVAVTRQTSCTEAPKVNETGVFREDISVFGRASKTPHRAQLSAVDFAVVSRKIREALVSPESSLAWLANWLRPL